MFLDVKGDFLLEEMNLIGVPTLSCYHRRHTNQSLTSNPGSMFKGVASSSSKYIEDAFQFSS